MRSAPVIAAKQKQGISETNSAFDPHLLVSCHRFSRQKIYLIFRHWRKDWESHWSGKQGEGRVANTYSAEANDREWFSFNLILNCKKRKTRKILESIEKEKELSDEEWIARKRAAKLEQVDDAGEREVQECASDLEFALEELDLAKDSLKKLAQKKEGKTLNFR